MHNRNYQGHCLQNFEFSAAYLFSRTLRFTLNIPKNTQRLFPLFLEEKDK